MSEIQSSISNETIGKSGGDRILAAFAGNSVAANLTMLVMLIGGFFCMEKFNDTSFPDPRFRGREHFGSVSGRHAK